MGFVAAMFVILMAFILSSFIMFSFFHVRFFTLEMTFLSMALALGFVSMTVYMLGICRLLYGVVILMVALGATAVSLLLAPHAWVTLWRDISSSSTQWVRNFLAHPIIGGLTLIFSLFIISEGILALYPPTAWDGIMYHLPLAEFYVHSHSLSYSPFIRYSFAPQANEMLYSLVLALGGTGVAAQLIEFVIMLLTSVGTYLIGLRYFSSRWTGILAAGLFLALQVTIDEGTSAYVDLWFVMYGLAALLSARRFLSGPVRAGTGRWAVLTGIFNGLSMDGKYSGMLVLFSLIVCLILFRVKIRKFIFLITISCLAISSPWYIRNLILTGDPAYPMLTNIFGNRGPWTQEQITYQISSFSSRGPISSVLLHNAILIWNQFIQEDGVSSYVPYIISLSLLQNHEPLCGKGFSSTKKDFTPT